MNDDPLTKTVEEERKAREELYGDGEPRNADPDTPPNAAPQSTDKPPEAQPNATPAATSSSATLPDCLAWFFLSCETSLAKVATF